MPVFTARVYLLWTSQDKQKSERCWEMKKMADFNNWPPSILAHFGPTKGPGGASGAIAKVNPLGTSLLIPPQCQKTTFCDFGFWTRTLVQCQLPVQKPTHSQKANILENAKKVPPHLASINSAWSDKKLLFSLRWNMVKENSLIKGIFSKILFGCKINQFEIACQG